MKTIKKMTEPKILGTEPEIGACLSTISSDVY